MSIGTPHSDILIDNYIILFSDKFFWLRILKIVLHDSIMKEWFSAISLFAIWTWLDEKGERPVDIFSIKSILCDSWEILRKYKNRTNGIYLLIDHHHEGPQTESISIFQPGVLQKFVRVTFPLICFCLTYPAKYSHPPKGI